MIKIKEKEKELTWEDFKKDPEVKELKTILRVILFVALFMLLYTVFSSIFASANLQTSQSVDNIEYTFQNDNLFNSTGLGQQRWWDNSSDTFNIRQKEEITNHFNATYSFENEIDGTNSTDIDFITQDDSGSACLASVISNFSKHDKILQLDDNSAAFGIGIFNDFPSNYLDGVYEFWFAKNSITNDFYFKILEDTDTLVMIRFQADDIDYYDGVYHSIIDDVIIVNSWFYIEIETDDTANTFNFYLNGILIDSGLDYDTNSVLGANAIQMFTEAGEKLITYIDAIGYSWDGYNATYSFNNELDGETGTDIDFIDTATLYDGNAIIINNLDNHYKILGLLDDITPGEDPSFSHNEIQSTFGIREYWVRTNDASEDWRMSLNDGLSSIVYLRILGDKLRYMDSLDVWQIIADFIDNTWYHIKSIWRNDNTFDIYLNEILIVDNQITNNIMGSGIDEFTYRGKGDSVDYLYLDGYGDVNNDAFYEIGDNLIHYFIGDNIIPYVELIQDEYEVDEWMFTHNPNTYTNFVDGYDNPYGWYETGDLPPLTDFINILNLGWSPGEPDWGYQRYTVVHTDNGGNNFYQNFNGIIDDYYNITYNFQINQLDDTDVGANAVICSIRDSDDVSWIASVYLRQNTNVELFHDGTSTILGTFDKTNNYTISFFINFPSKIFTFTMRDWNNMDILYEFTAGFYDDAANDIDRVSFDRTDTSNEVDTYLFSVSMYGTNGSYTEAVGELVWNDIGYPKLGIFGVWYLDQYNLLDLYANFENATLFREEFGGIIFHMFMDWREISSYEFVNMYDDSYNQDVFERIKLWMYGNFTFNSISIDGSTLVQDTNIYYLTLTNSTNMNITESYFYVSDNKLYYSLTTYNDNLEYINAQFNINSQITTNYTLLYGGIKNYINLIAEFRINYLDTTYSPHFLKVIPIYQNVIIPQGHSINTFDFLITDNDNDVDFTVSGYFNSFILVNTIGIEFTIIISDYLSILTPILLITIITITIWQATRKKVKTMLIAPSLILMSFSVFAMNLIPIWILFVMIIGSGILMYSKWEDNLSIFSSMSTMGTSFLAYAGIIPFWLFYISFIIMIGYLIFGVRKTVRG